MSYYFIKPDNVGRMVESLRQRECFGFDVETTGLDPRTAELRLMQFSPDPERAFLIDVRAFGGPRSPALAPVCELLSDASVEKIGHNLKFDAKFVKYHLGCDINSIWDTMICSQIEARGEKEIRHGLGFAAERFLGIEVDKTEQVSDWGTDELSERQLEYAAKDVCIMHELQTAILRRLMALGLLGVAQLENDIVMPLAQVELNGFYMDASRWRQQLRYVEGQARKIGDELQDLLSPGVRQTGLFGRLEIDLGSTQQVAQALLGLGVPVPTTEKGNYSTTEDLIEPLRYKFPAIEKLLEFRGIEKQRSSYGENILDLQDPETGRLHADFRQIKAGSGRMGCIAEGTLVDVPGGRVPIEQVKPGDYVYCYTDSGELTLRKVKTLWDNGVKECVEMVWRSSGKHDTGSLILTPDHKVKTRDRGWQEAKDLKCGEKVYHLRRSLTPRTDGSTRVRLFGAHSLQELEEHVIKREYFHADSSDHIHHLDEDPSNNVLDNFEVLSPSEHSKHHWRENYDTQVAVSLRNMKLAQANRTDPARGPENPLWIQVSRFGLLRMLAQAAGRPSKVPMDFETFKRKCVLAEIDIKAVADRYTSRGLYLSRRIVTLAYECGETGERTAQLLGIGTRRLKETCTRLGISYNHRVVSIRPAGTYRVYDLEVEDTHNYIAGEICVHNCSKPNLQQVPQQTEYRSCFRAPEGRKLVVADFSQIELRVMAALSEDPGMIAAFNSGMDYHTATAMKVFGIDDPEKVSTEERTFAKRVNFGIGYGIGPGKLSRMTGMDYETTVSFLDQYFVALPQLKFWLNKQKYMGTRQRQVKTLSGRTQRLFFDAKDNASRAGAERLSTNVPVQGTAADIFKRAFYLIHEGLKGTSGNIVNLVHDEFVVEADASDAQEVAAIMEECMQKAGSEYVTAVDITADAKVMEEWSK